MDKVRVKFKNNTPIPARHDRKCLVCGEPAHLFSPDQEPVCLRVECKYLLSKKQHMSENAFKQSFTLHSRQIKWIIRHTELKKQMLAEQREKEKKEYVSFLLEAIKDVHGAASVNNPYTMTSRNRQSLSRLPRRRQNLFRNFLSTLINETFWEIEGIEESFSEQLNRREVVVDVDPFKARACAFCRGVCCTTGWKDAYIKKETILRYSAEHPDQMQGHVLAAYMEHLGKNTYTDSCVFHTETGCCLPRSMRSETCNEFLCDTLIELDKLLNKTPKPRRIFLIEYAKENWRKEILGAENSVESRIHLLENYRITDEL